LPTDDDILKVITRGVRWTAMVGRADIAEPDRRAIVHYIKSFSPRFEQDRPLARIPVPVRPAESENLVRVGGQVYQKADCARCHGERATGDGPSGLGKDSWGQPIQASDLTWRPLKRGSVLEEVYLTIATGLSGTPMPSYGEALEKAQIWALVYYLDSIVPPERRLSGSRFLGEEQRGWMALHMQGMTGDGMMHAPMRSR
jgi:cytochrome c oxidase cbb3-type subunit 2